MCFETLNPKFPFSGALCAEAELKNVTCTVVRDRGLGFGVQGLGGRLGVHGFVVRVVSLALGLHTGGW